MNRSAAGYWAEVGRWSLLVLLAFELVLRLFVVKSPQSRYVPEWGVVPVEGEYSMQGSEGYAFLRYMDHGELETPHQGGRSIVVLGDSTTLAAQVDPSENFVSVTESTMRKRGFDVDLHNLGRSARIMADHVFLAPVVNETFAPEVVIIQVSPDSFTLSYDPDVENYFAEENGFLTLYHQTPPAVANLAMQNATASSGLLEFASIRFWLTLNGLEKSHPGWFATPLEGNLGGVNAPPPLAWDAVTPERLQDLRKQVLEQVAVVREAYRDSVIVFLVVPSPPKVFPEERRLDWSGQADAHLAAVLNGIDGVHVVFPLNFFQKHYENQNVLPRGHFNSAFNYGHLNPLGHRAVAQALSLALKEILK